MRGVFIGRFSPVHRGHIAVMTEMFEQCAKSLVIIGSCTEPMSMRHFFSYEQRRSLIKTIFPVALSVMGMPDYHSDEVWLTALDDVISCVFDDYPPKVQFNGHFKPPTSIHRKIVFFGGCEEDVQFFINAGREVHIVNRYDGTTPKVSASEVRDCLLNGRSLEGKVSPVLIKPVTDMFKTNWEIFKNK